MDVTLVSMPFAEVQRPSIALGLLQASLAGTGIRSEVVYGNLRFAETIGVVAYQAIQSTPTDHLLGEWCFADRLLSDVEGQDDEYLDLVLDVRCRGFPADLEQRKNLMRWMRAAERPLRGSAGPGHRRARAADRGLQLDVPAALRVPGAAQANPRAEPPDGLGDGRGEL